MPPFPAPLPPGRSSGPSAMPPPPDPRPIVLPDSSANPGRTCSSISATSTRPGPWGFPALLPATLRPPRRHHDAHHRQPRVAQPVQRLLPVLGSQEGSSAAALVEAHHRRLADPRPELTGASRRRLRPGQVARAHAGGRARATAASRSGIAPATARAPTAARPTSTRSWNRLVATRASSSAATTTTSSGTRRRGASRSTSSAPAAAAATRSTAGTRPWSGGGTT